MFVSIRWDNVCCFKIHSENTTKFDTVLFLVIGNIIATIINYLIAKQLNKDGLKHTIGAGVSLEKAVLGLGIGVCILAVIIYFAK